MKGSDKETCGDYGGMSKQTGEPCERVAGWGTEFEEGKCSYHRGTNADGSSHEGNDFATTHGAFKEHFRSDLEDDEKTAIDSLVAHLRNIEDERAVAAEVAAEALIKYKRSKDSRFLTEARQWFSEFNLLPNSDTMELTGDGGGGIVINVDNDERE